MNSAHSERPKSTAKIHSDHSARRLRLKLFQRRLFSGDSEKNPFFGSGGRASAGFPSFERSGPLSGSGFATMAQPSRFSKSMRGSTATYIRSDSRLTNRPIIELMNSVPKITG